MSDNNKQSVQTKSKQYKYIIECKEQTVELDIEEQDIIRNADNEIDCPLDVVLRKNAYSLNDLMSWNPSKGYLVVVSGDETHVINTLSLNVNL